MGRRCVPCGNTLANLDLDNGLAEVAKAVQVQARCLSSRRHVKAWPCTSGRLSPYTLRKYGAGCGDLAQYRVASSIGGGEEVRAPLMDFLTPQPRTVI
jgi:hypothetical protein